MSVVFFDFDGTLTRHDTFIEFAKFSVGRMAFIKAFVKSIPMLVLWKVGIISNSKAKQKLFSYLYRGMYYVQFNEYCSKFKDVINDDLRSEVFDALQNHRNSGHRIVIVSASIGNWIRPWAESFGITDVLATEIETDKDGRITGNFTTKNCYGEEKVSRIREYMPEIDHIESWAYGDSSGDEPMLNLVRHAKRV